ncbi:MAG: phosphoribosylglycinamide formyltransferase, partial [Dehalococcoidia bacterium]
MLRIGWFSTGRGEGSRGLLQFVQERLRRNDLEAQIEFVFSNRAPGEAEGSDQFFELVRSYGLPLLTCSSAQFRKARGGPWPSLRPDYDRQVMELLQEYHPDICVLAGYMLIVGGEMCQRYPLLNLHPALPDGPVGTWQEV